MRANSRRGAAEAVRHLHGAGRRRIALRQRARARRRRASRAQARLPRRAARVRARARRRLVEIAEDFTIEPGRAAVERLLDGRRPDAIFCANDLLALGALSALRARRPRRAARRRARRHGQHEPLGRHLAAPDDRRPRLAPSARASPPSCCSRASSTPSRRARIVGVEPTPRRPRVLVRSAGMTTVPEPRRLISRQAAAPPPRQRGRRPLAAARRCCS